MSPARAPYMEWAKTRPAPAIDLAGSNLLACSLDDLPGARDAVDLAGENPDGYPPLLEAIARHAGVGPERVATGAGCSGANFLALAAMLSPGDEVLVESPGYDPLVAAAEMLGASVRRFPRRFEEGFGIDAGGIAAALTPGTRVVVLSDPHNPSGVLLPERQLDDLAALAEERGIEVLVDEVYLDVVLPPRRAPAAARSERFVSTSSLTKAYGLSSLRCGWVLARPDLARRVRRARDVVDVSGAVPAERLSLLAFRHLGRLTGRMRALVDVNGALVAGFLAGRPELESVPPRGTIVFPRFRDGSDAGHFAEGLLRDHGVAVVPGAFFEAPAHFRLAFGGATDPLRRGLEAIGRQLDARSGAPGGRP
ncbi:MAG: pyridoxal phosphate-dependent aminotransferase [Thermoanaerobaculia bacterium]